jgi:hypothetical protein
MSDRHTVFVFTNPVEGKEDEFNAWYDGVHIPEVLRTDGYLSVTRYKVSPRQANMGPLESPEGGDGRLPRVPPQTYVAVWELEGDLKTIFTGFRDRFLAGEIHMAEVFTDVRSWTFTALGPTARATEAAVGPVPSGQISSIA